MTSHLKGPNQGDWSVFAEKVVAERDDLRARLAEAERERDEAQTELACFREGTYHPDPEMNREIEADRAEARAYDAAHGIKDAHHKGRVDWEHRAAELQAERDGALKDVTALREVLGDLLVCYEEGQTNPEEVGACARSVLASLHPGAEYVPASRLREVAERVREECSHRAQKLIKHIVGDEDLDEQDESAARVHRALLAIDLDALVAGVRK